MKIHSDVIIGVGLLVFCGTAAKIALKLSGGAEVMPLVLIVLMACMATIIFFKGIKNTANKSTVKDSVDKAVWSECLKPINVFVSTVIYGGLFYWLGFFTATLLFLVFLFMYLGLKNWKLILSITVIYELIIYALFVIMLDVPLY